MKKSTIIKYIVKYGIPLLVLVFFLRILYINWNKINWQELHFVWYWAFLASVAFIIFFVGYAFIATSILRRYYNVSFSRGIDAILVSQLGKYIPGKLWLLAGRMLILEKVGVPKKVTTIAMAFEIVVLLISGVCIAFLFGSDTLLGLDAVRNPIFIVFFILLLLFFLYPKVFSYIMNIITKKMHKEKVSYSLNMFSSLLFAMLFSVLWIFWGLGFFLTSKSILPNAELHFFQIWSASIISWVVGFLFIFVPGGLGVREGLFAFILAPILGKENAIIVALMSRLVISIAEGTTSLAAYTHYRGKI